MIAAGVNPLLAADLATRFQVHRWPDDVDPAAEVLVASIAEVDVAMLDRLPKLRLVATSGAGYDYIDVKALKARGIALSNARGTKDVCGADHAVGLLLDCVRGISEADRFVRTGRWPGSRFRSARRFAGRRVGIYGMGGIGGAAAKRIAAFGCEVGYHNRSPRAGLPYRYFADLKLMAEWCDDLVIACPLTPQTRGSVDAALIAALGPEGCLVNIARGEIVDQEALIDALERKVLGAAGVDVLEGEPDVPARLLALDNVVMTPHVAVQTRESQADTRRLVIANVESFLATGRLISPIDLGQI